MSANKKIYISLAVFLAVTLCFVCFVFFPLLRGIGQDGDEIVFQQQKLYALKTREATLSELRRNHREYEEKLSKVENLFWDPEYPLEALDYLEKLALLSGVEINTSALSHSDRGSPWQFFSVKISLVSNFDNLMRFVDGLENTSKLVEISNPSFRKEGDQIQAAFSVKFFTEGE